MTNTNFGYTASLLQLFQGFADLECYVGEFLSCLIEGSCKQHMMGQINDLMAGITRERVIYKDLAW